jgi:ABC-type multidrug transport system ATPase subunit/predicted component of type VI protein secretion system
MMADEAKNQAQPSEPRSEQSDQDGTLLIQSPHLVIHWPDGKVDEHTLERGKNRAGRDPESNQIVIPEAFESISREHFEIRQEGGRFRLVDLGSRNGVRVNDVRLEGEVALQDGDELKLGLPELGHEVRMVFRAGTLGKLREAQSLGAEQAAIPPPERIVDGPSLRVQFPDRGETVTPIKGDVTLLGRSEQADLRFPAELRYVSSRHAEIRREGENFVVIDLESTNGTRLNGQRLPPGQSTPLRDGAVLRIGDEALGISVGLYFSNPAERALSMDGFSPTILEPTRRVEEKRIVIGRSPDCDVVLSSPMVSRQHAAIEGYGDVYRLIDLNSLNGTYLNDQRITAAELKDGDVIQIESHALLFQDGQVTQFDSHGMRVDVTNLSQQVSTRRGPLRILDDISFTILPREFIALVGASGSGKSTLMKGLIGTWPAEGEVKLNGYNLYQEYDNFRSQFGYVPQAEILHTTLTVERALEYAARLRLPPDVSGEERAQRITQVLETVGMNSDVLRTTRISRLSGGQRKRVSIAAELLADPKLFFLDEATSGLDPGLEKKMMHTLRRMADEGRTIVLITHATANIIQVDHVAFLAEGKLVFFGPPQESLDFFEVDEFADIYERTAGGGNRWRRVFQEGKPEHHQQYVVERQKGRFARELHRAGRQVKAGLGNFVRQLGVLTQRTMNVLTSDLLTLGLLLLLFPLTATLQLLISSPDILTGDLSILADPAQAALDLTESYMPFPDLNTFVFVMGLEAVLVGMYVPSNELIKERSIYLRERMVNLKLPPYLMSKVAVFTLFAVLQCVLYLLVLSLGVDFPERGLSFPFEIELFITLFLTMMAGIGIGLLVSSISRSSDMAIYLLVILLFFQFFFAGTVFDLRGKAAEPLSYMTTTRWSLLALGVTIDIEGQTESSILCTTMPDDPRTPQVDQATVCRHHPEATDDLMLPYSDDALVQSWAILTATMMLTVGMTGLLIKRLDRT